MAIHTNLFQPSVAGGRFGAVLGGGSPAPPKKPAKESDSSKASTRPQFTPASINPAAFLPPNLTLEQPFVVPPIFSPTKTTTQIAKSAVNLLNNASASVVSEAINTVKNRRVAAGSLMSYLERKVKIGEVLNELAKDWSSETREDFAGAFQTVEGKLDVMDAIVSLAILNDGDLEDEIRAENTSDATEGDMLENRRVVWQHPMPGTVLQPPYVILLAVERTDVEQADDVVRSILDDLADYQGFKLPKAAAQKLR